MNLAWLFLICPLCAAIGALGMVLMLMASVEDHTIEQEAWEASEEKKGEEDNG